MALLPPLGITSVLTTKKGIFPNSFSSKTQLMATPSKLHFAKLIRSTIRCHTEIKETVKLLGFRKVGQTRILKNTPVVNGATKCLLYFVRS